MSLERLVREFAERVRAELIARIESEKDQDIAIVKWQGFDENGNPIVKDTDQIRTAKGLGNISQKIGSKLIYDKAGSVEYKQKRITKLDVIKKKKLPEALRARRISRTPLLVDLFESLDIPIIAFYMLTYSTQKPGANYSINSGIGAGQSQYPSANPSTSEIVSNYTAEATQGVTYRISIGAVAVACQSLFSQPGSASASISGLGLNLTLAIATPTGSDEQTDISLNVEQSVSGGTIDQQCQASAYTVGSTVYQTGDSEARSQWAFVSFPRAVYYFQTPEDAEVGDNPIREIDLNAIVPNRVYNSRIAHNYVSREGDDIFAYTIYYVLDVDMSQHYQVQLTNTTTIKRNNRLIGKITRYIIHTKLNLLTGTYEHKINESLNTGEADAATGQLRQYDATGWGETWLLNIELRALSQPTSSSSTCLAYALINDPDYHFKYFSQGHNSLYAINPEAVWRESYEGDWLYAYRNLSWDFNAASNINGTDINQFLNLSYKNSFFWQGIDTRLDENYITAPFFKRKDITGTGWEGNTPINGTFSDIEDMYTFTLANPTTFVWSNYFDGSVPNVPNDYNSWRSWTFIEWLGLALIGSIPAPRHYYSTYSEKVWTLPNFSLAQNVLESGNKIGDRLSYDSAWFNFVPLDSIRIVSYEIAAGIVTLTTASQGYAFNASDLIDITEDAAINGQYSIYQVVSNTEFKISIPGSTNTAGSVTSTGIATKLPPTT